MNDLIYPVSKVLHVFDDDEFGVVRIYMIGGLPYYLSNDVTKILNFSNNLEALENYVNCYDKLYVRLYENLGEYIFVNDCGLYCLSLNSDREFSLDFRTILSVSARRYAIELYNDKVYNEYNIVKNNWDIISKVIRLSIDIIDEYNRKAFIKSLVAHLVKTNNSTDIKCKNTYVYFIKDEHGNTKIGISNNIDKRLSTLQTGNADKLEIIDYFGPFSRSDALLIERELHNKYNFVHVNGEWFNIDDYGDIGNIIRA